MVKDYFRKAGLPEPADEDIIVTEGTFGDSRRVQIQVSEQMPTWFMAMVGVRELSTPAASTAEESVGQIEISMILDISGSMGRNNRLVNLKPAAKSFVDQIFDSAEADKVSISIIPYSTQVGLSDDLAGYFDITGEHNYSNCIEFDSVAGDFNTTTVSLAGSGRTYQRNGHFDPFYRARPTRLLNCRDTANAEILPFSGDRDALKAKIDSLSADGNTSIDIGMKWGAALLDPSMQAVMDGMIAAGSRPADFGDRPYTYDNGEVLKIIVLMTDGANTTEYRLVDEYDSGDSRLYTNTWYLSNYPTSKNQFSYYDPQRAGGKYYSFRTDSWRSQPYGDASGDYGDAVLMTWPEVWDTMSIRYFADNIAYDATNSSGVRNHFRYDTKTSISSTKDSITSDMCDATKAQGVKDLFDRLRGAVGRPEPAAGLRQLGLQLLRGRRARYPGSLLRHRQLDQQAEADPLMARVIPSLGAWLRRKAREEDGTATIPFIIFLPFFMLLIMSALEMGTLMLRHVMLERALDLSVRDLRLGIWNDPTHDEFKRVVCNRAGVLPDCMNVMVVELRPVSTITWEPLAAGPVCVDRAEPMLPEDFPEFEDGEGDEMMLIRACVKFDPLFPTTGARVPSAERQYGGLRVGLDHRFRERTRVGKLICRFTPV